MVKELYNQIRGMLGNSPVEIVQGKGYIEVKPTKLKKHKLMKKLLEKASANTKIDYILYIGVDTDNERTYSFLNSERSDVYFSREHAKYVCTLGKKPSSAHYYLDDIEEVKYIINRLRHSTQKRKRTRSYSDLRECSPLIGPL